jgi:4'-phosphopantetheinyl transferase
VWRRGVHVLSASPVDHRDLGLWLDGSERHRQSSFRLADDRDRFATSRALVKTLVASVARVPAGAVRLTYVCRGCGRAHGRPMVAAPDQACAVHVSISHAGSRVVVAATAAGPVGVDVEPAGAASFSGFDDLVLTPAEAAWVDRAPIERRHRARTSYWVRKEAVLKATGYGLSVPATTVEVSSPNRRPAVVAWHARPAAPSPVQLWDLDVGRDHIGCVALLSASEPVLRVSTDVRIAPAP